jgi:hypothetical protein
MSIIKEEQSLTKLNDAIKSVQLRLDSISTREHYMNARQAAAYIGISVRLFNERIKLGMWTCHRVGRRRVFRKSEIDADLDAFKEESRFRKPGGLAA